MDSRRHCRGIRGGEISKKRQRRKVSLELGEWDAGEDLITPPPRGWLLGNSFCRGFVSSLLGGGGVGKTALRYAQMLSLAAFVALTGEHVFQRCRVLIVSLEDGSDELRRRILAARIHHKIERSQIAGWLFLSALGKKDGKLMTLDEHGRPIVSHLASKLAHTITKRKIDVVLLDPFIKTHTLNENDNSGIDEVAQILTDICGRFNIALDIPHHMSKGAGDPGNPHKGRGASSLNDALRLVRTANVMTDDEAKGFGISETERRRIFRVDDAKLNIAPVNDAKWYKLVGIKLDNATELYPNGDDVQTVETWTPPNLLADISIPTIHAILKEIDAGLPDGNRYSDTKNVADERAAWIIVRRHCGKEQGPSKAIIKAWVELGTPGASAIHQSEFARTLRDFGLTTLRGPSDGCANSPSPIGANRRKRFAPINPNVLSENYWRKDAPNRFSLSARFGSSQLVGAKILQRTKERILNDHLRGKPSSRSPCCGSCNRWERRMKMTDADIIWTPIFEGEDDVPNRGSVRVERHGCGWQRGRGDRWMPGTSLNNGHQADPIKQLLAVFIQFNALVVRDHIEPEKAHAAFLTIDEYRKAISLDTPGADE